MATVLSRPMVALQAQEAQTVNESMSHDDDENVLWNIKRNCIISQASKSISIIQVHSLHTGRKLRIVALGQHVGDLPPARIYSCAPLCIAYALAWPAEAAKPRQFATTPRSPTAEMTTYTGTATVVDVSHALRVLRIDATARQSVAPRDLLEVGPIVTQRRADNMHRAKV